MTTRPAAPLLRYLRRVALRGDDGATTDARLLEEYLLRADADAFAALVRRHGPMVRAVCRRILRDDHDADDACQATFLVLIHKAASVSPRTAVANWLYGVAYRTALKARTAAARRRATERRAAVPGHRDEDAAAGQEVRTLLDRELNRLPEKYRTVIVVCDLEGKTRKAAASQLGWPEGTVAGRLTRARALLARRLSRHGISAPVAALAAVAAGSAADAADLSAPDSARVGSGAASVRATGLARAVARSMGLVRLRLASAVLIAAVGMVAVTRATVAFGEPPEKRLPVAKVAAPQWPPVPAAGQLVRYLNDSAAGVESLKGSGIYLDITYRGQSLGMTGNFAFLRPGNFRLNTTIAGQRVIQCGCNDRECWYWLHKEGQFGIHQFPLEDVNARDRSWFLPNRPEWLLESAGFTKLDPSRPREVVVRAKTYELVEKTVTAQGRPAFKVAVFKRDAAAVQVPERLIRDAGGNVLCKATVREVFTDAATGNVLPREVEWDWPGHKLRVKVKLNDVKVNPKIDEGLWDVPFECPITIAAP